MSEHRLQKSVKKGLQKPGISPKLTHRLWYRPSSMLKQRKTENPMGECRKHALRVVFDGRLKLEFHGSKVTVRRRAAGLSGTGRGARSDRRWRETLLNEWRTGNEHAAFMVACFASRSSAAWRDMRTPTMPSGSRSIRRCGRWWAGGPRNIRRPRPARWAGSRPKC